MTRRATRVGTRVPYPTEVAMRFVPPIVAVLTLVSGSPALPKERFTCPAGTTRIDDEQMLGGRHEYCQKQMPSGEYAKHGPFRAWNEDGLLVVRGQFEDGLEVGEWAAFHGGAETDSGWSLKKNQQSLAGSFDAGKRVGPWTEWHANGQKSLEGTYVAGERDGLVIEWHPNGRKATEAQYRVGALHGRSQAWYTNGSPIHDATYKDGKADGAWTKWFEDGSLQEQGTYANGVRVGKWSVWSSPKTLSWSGEFDENGVPHGEWVQMVMSTYSARFAPERQHKGRVANGLREGPWTVVDGPEELLVHFRAGKYDGTCEARHKGVLHVVTTYKDGLEVRVVLYKKDVPYITWEISDRRRESCTPHPGEQHLETPECGLVRRPSCLSYGFPRLPPE